MPNSELLETSIEVKDAQGIPSGAVRLLADGVDVSDCGEEEAQFHPTTRQEAISSRACSGSRRTG